MLNAVVLAILLFQERTISDYYICFSGMECVWCPQLFTSTCGEVFDHSDSGTGEGRS